MEINFANLQKMRNNKYSQIFKNHEFQEEISTMLSWIMGRLFLSIIYQQLIGKTTLFPLQNSSRPAES
jgi:hypothetical protein